MKDRLHRTEHTKFSYKMKKRFIGFSFATVVVGFLVAFFAFAMSENNIDEETHYTNFRIQLLADGQDDTVAKRNGD